MKPSKLNELRTIREMLNEGAGRLDQFIVDIGKPEAPPVYDPALPLPPKNIEDAAVLIQQWFNEAEEWEYNGIASRSTVIRLRQDVANLQNRMESNAKENNQLRHQLETKDAINEGLHTRIENLLRDIGVVVNERDSLKAEVLKLMNQRTDLTHQKEFWESESRKFEGLLLQATSLPATPWEVKAVKMRIGGDTYVAIEDAGPECPCIVALVPENKTSGVMHQHAIALLIAEAPGLKTALNRANATMNRLHTALANIMEWWVGCTGTDDDERSNGPKPKVDEMPAELYDEAWEALGRPAVKASAKPTVAVEREHLAAVLELARKDAESYAVAYSDYPGMRKLVAKRIDLITQLEKLLS